MRAGPRSDIAGIGHIHITAVEPVDIDARTDDDAVPDGLPSAVPQSELLTIDSEKSAIGYDPFRVAFERITD
jgi:hypothetical protein